VATLKCLCGASFKPNAHQETLIEQARANSMSEILLDCPECMDSVSLSLAPGGRPAPEREPETPPPLRCPVLHCSGWVSLIPPSATAKGAKRRIKEQAFWGCGECGSVWYDANNLQREITAIVKRFAYRKKCYVKRGGKWEPASSLVKGYETRVEAEPVDKVKDYVRG